MADPKPAPSTARYNVWGQVRTNAEARSLAHRLAEEECKPVDEEKRKKVKQATADAAARRDAAFERAQQRADDLYKELSQANKAFQRQDMTQDLVDLAGAVANVVGLFHPVAWLIRAGSFGLGVLNDYARPEPPALLEAGNQSLGAAGLSPSTLGGRVIVRAGIERAAGVAGAVGGIASAVGSDAMGLELSRRGLDALRELKSKLARVEPTAVQRLFGLDKEKLTKAVEDSIAAEEEYQRAHEAWAKALAAETALVWDSTCVQKRESEIYRQNFDPHVVEMRMLEENARRRRSR